MRVLAIGLQLLALSGMAQEYGEYEVKAAYLYNFARFAKWPTSVFAEDSSLLVLIVGKIPLATLDALAGKAVDTHAIRIQHMTGLPGVALRGCHLLFISRSEQGQSAATAGHARRPAGAQCQRHRQFRPGRWHDRAGRARPAHSLRYQSGSGQRSGIELGSQLLKLARVFDE